MGAFRISAAFAMLFVGLSTSASAWEETRNMQLPAAGIDQLTINCGSGSLTVSGREDAADISVRAEIVVERTGREEAREMLEDRLILSLERRGARAVLISEFDNDGWGFWRNLSGRREVRVNLTIVLPAGFDVDIDDGSGDIEISNVGDTVIDDGSGNITIRNAGELYIDDGSGNIDVYDVAGDATIDDGSGDMILSGVNGHVVIDDGSGNIEVSEVEDGVKVDGGSGNTVLKDITGHIDVDSKHAIIIP